MRGSLQHQGGVRQGDRASPLPLLGIVKLFHVKHFA